MENQEEIINDDSKTNNVDSHSHMNDNELTLHNNNLERNDHADQLSENSEKIIRDPEDPKHWPRKKKNLVLFIISLAGMIAPISSTIIYPSVFEVASDLHASEVLANGLIGVYIFFMGVAPLGWAAYSDTLKTRRNVYLASFVMYITGSIICAVSKNIWLLLVMRSIQSCGSSAVLSIGAGTISDVFHSLERGRAYGIFYTGPLLGPVIGPVIGGYVSDYLGWRWIFWILAIIGVVLVILIFFLLPETFAPPSNLPNPNTTTFNPRRQKRFDPLSPLFLLRYPNMSLIVIYVSILFALLHVQDTLVDRNFTKLYNVSTSIVGLIFLAPGCGYIIGSIIGGKWSDYVIIKAKRKNNDVGYPEMRLYSVWIGCFFITVTYICYGWFLEAQLHIAFPIIAMFIGGFNVMIVVNSVSTYLVDVFPGKSASAIAVNNLMRSLTAAIFTFAAAPFEDAVGTSWIYTIMIFISIIGILCLIIVCYKGKDLREKAESKNNK